jgi:hypothetical protein
MVFAYDEVRYIYEIRRRLNWCLLRVSPNGNGARDTHRA